MPGTPKNTAVVAGTLAVMGRPRATPCTSCSARRRRDVTRRGRTTGRLKVRRCVRASHLELGAGGGRPPVPHKHTPCEAALAAQAQHPDATQAYHDAGDDGAANDGASREPGTQIIVEPCCSVEPGRIRLKIGWDKGRSERERWRPRWCRRWAWGRRGRRKWWWRRGRRRRQGGHGAARLLLDEAGGHPASPRLRVREAPDSARTHAPSSVHLLVPRAVRVTWLGAERRDVRAHGLTALQLVVVRGRQTALVRSALRLAVVGVRLRGLAGARFRRAPPERSVQVAVVGREAAVPPFNGTEPRNCVRRWRWRGLAQNDGKKHTPFNARRARMPTQEP